MSEQLKCWGGCAEVFTSEADLKEHLKSCLKYEMRRRFEHLIPYMVTARPGDTLEDMEAEYQADVRALPGGEE